MSSAALTDRQVLVVDDDADIRTLVRIVLEREGAEVIECSDGESCLASVAQTRPDAVILDVSMPGIDGFETLASLRESSSTPVVMLTGQGGEEVRMRSLRAGADAHLVKPFRPRELVECVATLLRRED